jgi:regulator of nucleoside diphosphate kinase
MNTFDHDIMITNSDLQRLLPVIEQSDTPASEALEMELHRAVIVDPEQVPTDLVTMNSELVYEDVDTQTRRRVTLVYPKDADASRGRISVLAPIGSALLGLRVGQEIDWQTPSGPKRIRVVEVHYQPEANGNPR